LGLSRPSAGDKFLCPRCGLCGLLLLALTTSTTTAHPQNPKHHLAQSHPLPKPASQKPKLQGLSTARTLHGIQEKSAASSSPRHGKTRLRGLCRRRRGPPCATTRLQRPRSITSILVGLASARQKAERYRRQGLSPAAGIAPKASPESRPPQSPDHHRGSPHH